jgi:hypothetical protein
VTATTAHNTDFVPLKERIFGGMILTVISPHPFFYLIKSTFRLSSVKQAKQGLPMLPFMLLCNQSMNYRYGKIQQYPLSKNYVLSFFNQHTVSTEMHSPHEGEPVNRS